MSNPNFTGDWYIPDGRRFPGIVETDKINGKIKLDIYSAESFDGKEINFKTNTPAHYHQYILGDGQMGFFTLYHCNLINCSFIGRNFYKCVYEADFLIIGAQIAIPGDILIRSGEFTFPYLAGWHGGWEYAEELPKLEGKLTDINLAKTETLKINEDLELVFSDWINSRIEELGFSYLIRYNKHLIFKYNKDVPLARMLKDSLTFQKLLELAHGKPLNRSLLSVEIAANNVLYSYHHDASINESSQYNVVNFSLNQNKPIEKGSENSAHTLIHNGKLTKVELHDVIKKRYSNTKYVNIVEYYLDSNNWFQDSRKAVLSNVMFNNRFLNLVQGLEDYYRVNYEMDADRKVFDNRKAEVLKVITDPELKHWLNDTFKYTKYVTLEKKYETVLNECLPVIKNVFGNVILDDFPKAAAKFRNELSHGKNKEINLGEELHLNYHIAQLLLLICILRSLQIDNIEKLLSRHFKLQRKMQEIQHIQAKIANKA